MKLKTKQCLSDLADSEACKADLDFILQEVNKDKKVAQTYADYLFISDCIKGEINYSLKNPRCDIADEVMRQINPRRNILTFIPTHIPQLAIAASTFLAITLGVYFYTPDDASYLAQDNPPATQKAQNAQITQNSQIAEETQAAQSVEFLAQTEDSMSLKLNGNFFDRVDNLSASNEYDGKLTISPLTVLDIEKQNKLRPDELYISPMIRESVLEASAKASVRPSR